MSFKIMLPLALGIGFNVDAYANTFIFNPRSHSYTAINDNGKVVKTGRASGGSSWCSDIKRSCRTPVGSFRVWSKGGPGCKSSRYPKPRGGAPMPYCMFFSKYYAVHGSNDVPNHNASHGCVRVTPSDAQWLSANFIHVGTKVVVKPY
jgi:lipoprotein-anchoring transpeptidase ErfK/SrfK